MKAIYKKELRLFYTTMTGYVAAAMMLVLVGVCSHVVNLKGGLSGLEYALLSSRWALALVVPVLTMRSFVEEKKQHTDLLLSASPVTPAQIVLGKFFATATVYALPLAVVGFYPLIFSAYGSIDLPSALLALLAMLLLGLALILALYMTRKDKRAQCIAGAVFSLFEPVAPLAFGLVWFYSGERGGSSKLEQWAFYWFYPAHIFVLGILANLLLFR